MRIAYDIDDTLWKICKHDKECRKNPDDCDVTDLDSFCNVHRPSSHQVPDYDLIQVLRWFHQNGDTVYVWSAGGVHYAKDIMTKLGLIHLVTIIPKGKNQDIDICFDDMKTNLAKVDVRVNR